MIDLALARAPPDVYAGHGPKEATKLDGAGGGTRTRNPLFTRQVRCQLRHAGISPEPRRGRAKAYPSDAGGLQPCAHQPPRQ